MVKFSPFMQISCRNFNEIWDYSLIATQPRELEQQTKRLKEATAKVYYTDGRDNIDQKTKHNYWCWLQRFQALEAEAQKWKADEERLAEQLADLQKDQSCRMKCGESSQPQVWDVWDPHCARTPIPEGQEDVTQRQFECSWQYFSSIIMLLQLLAQKH